MNLFRSLPLSTHMLGLLVAIMAGLWCGFIPVQAQDAFELEREEFGAVTLTPGVEGTEIEIGNSPGGLLLKAQLDPTVTYRLIVTGDGDPINLRIRSDEQPYEYREAPTGRAAEFLLRNTKHVEVLLYSDRPAHYLLQEVRVELCNDCDRPQGNLAGGLLQREHYGAAQINVVDNTVELVVGDAPGGITLRTADGVKGTFQLTFTGQGSAFAMRSRQKDGSYIYTSAPQKLAQMILVGGPNWELLIFSDTPGKYSLRDLEFSSCPTCVTPLELSHQARFQLLGGLTVIMFLALLADIVCHKGGKS